MTTSPNDFVDQVLGTRYQVESLLGKKAGRRTVLARDTVNHELVVVKILTFGNDFSWDDLKLFEREAKTLQSIHHNFIPQYLDFFDFELGKGKGYALVQTYVHGKSLEEYIQTGYKFTTSEIQEIATKLLSILDYLHQQQPPIIHRDIKPSNIIIQKNKQENQTEDSFAVYLVDFGSVQTCASKAGNTMTVVGTYGYMPPEQFGGRASPASDLYSLGATLITCATGIHPADLPHNDMQIDFSRHTTLSENFSNWLSWLTHPTLEHRAQDAKSALTILDQHSFRHQQVHVSRFELFWQSIGRNILVGLIIVPLSAGLYGSFLYPGIGTIAGATIGLFIGLPTSLFNAVLIWLITIFKFYPLHQPLLYQQFVKFLSILIGTTGYLIGVGSFGFFSSNQGWGNALLLAFAPAIIIGFSLGVTNRNLAYWYEKKRNNQES